MSEMAIWLNGPGRMRGWLRDTSGKRVVVGSREDLIDHLFFMGLEPVPLDSGKCRHSNPYDPDKRPYVLIFKPAKEAADTAGTVPVPPAGRDR
jgi:hypothetical protein